MRKSLTRRIVALSFLGITFLLLVSGSAITWAFNQSVERSLNNNLSAYLDLLIASTNTNSKGVPFLHSEMEMLQTLPRYWQVTAGTRHIKKSPLLADWIKVNEASPNELHRIYVTDTDGTKIIAVQQSIIFPGNKKVTYIFGVQKEIADEFLVQERQKFFHILLIVLGSLAGLLMIFTYIQVRLSIAPLADIKTSLQQIRSGKTERLSKNFPKEIQLLADEVNTLLHYSSNIIERYRNSASNLAHALKTPLSVLRNEAGKDNAKLAVTIREKTDVMLTLIDRNLARVKAAGSGNILSARVKITPITRKIARSFGKLYEKEVTITGEEEINFRGDEGDLYEILGNIIENACKYATSKIAVDITLTSPQGKENHQTHAEYIAITVDDDGKGVPLEERPNVLKRGKRLDETIPGTGIGLPIAQDIIALYGGSLSLADSPLGGLRVEILLPSAK